MSDLASKVAWQIFSKSLKLKKGSSVTVETWDCNEDLARKVELEAAARGHSVITLYNDTDSFIKSANRLPAGRKVRLGKHEEALLRNTDAYVFIPGPELFYSTTSLNHSRLRSAISYNMEWYRIAKESKLRGVRLGAGYFNSDAAASILGRTRKSIVDHLLNASLEDPSVLHRRAKLVSSCFRKGGKVTLDSGKFTLLFRTGKEEEIGDGRTDEEDLRSGNNMSDLPGGLYLREISGEAEGKIACASLTYQGKSTKSVEIEFSKGRVVSFSSKSWEGDAEESMSAYLSKQANRAPTYLGVGLNSRLKPGYGRDSYSSGAVTLWIGQSARAVLMQPTLHSFGRTVVNRGRLAV